MKSAGKAAVISVGLIAVLVGGYFFFVADPSTPVFTTKRPDAGEAGEAESIARETASEEAEYISRIPEEGSIGVSVKIVEAATGRPLSRSRLRVLRKSDTDAIGKIALDLPRPGEARTSQYRFSLAPGMYELQARCREYAGEELEVTLVDGGEPLSHTFELRRGNSISGRVLAAGSGSPIAGAEVAAFRKLAGPDADMEELLRAMVNLEELSREARDSQFIAVSGPDGAYYIDGLDPSWYSVRAVAGGFSPGERGPVPAPSEDIDIYLQPGGTVEGVVQSTTGGPIEGAVVEAFREPENAGLIQIILTKAQPAVDEAKTDSAGRFQLTKVGTGLYNFRVSAPGFQTLTESKIRIAPGKNNVRDYVLEPGRMIRGIVRGPDNQALSGASVKVNRIGGSRHREGQISIEFKDDFVETDERGVFVFDTLEDGPHMLMVYHDDYQSVQRRDVRPSDEDYVIILEAGGQMEGLVLDAATGQPIPGALVSVSDLGSKRKEKYTDQSGHYFISGLNTTRSKLTAYVRAKNYAREKRDIRVRDGRKINQNFELRSTGSVVGRVVLAGGDGVPGAHVEVRRIAEQTGTAQIVGSGQSESDGSFVIKDVEPGNQLRVRVKKKTFLDAYTDNFALESGEEREVGQVELHLGGSVDGIVKDTAGRPIVGCMVEARPEGSTDIAPQHGTMSVQTAKDGSYLIQGLRNGRHDLVFKATNYVEQVITGVEVREGYKNTGQNVTLEPAGIVEGRVVNPDGIEISGAEVIVKDFSEGFKELRAVSDGRGRFRFANIAAKDVVGMEVTHPEYSNWAEDRVRVGDLELEVVLTPLGQISGRVFDPDGNPVPSFSVQPQPRGKEARRDPRNRLRAKTFQDGRFVYSGVPDGVYDVYVRSPQYSAATVEGVEIRGSAPVHIEDVVLKEGGRIGGRVVEAGTGTPVSGARVKVVQGLSRFRDRSSKSVITTGGDGAFVFTGMKDGAVSLEVIHNDFVKKRVDGVDTQIAAESQDLLIELERGGEIIGRVEGASGRAMNNMPVYLKGKGKSEVTRSDAQGGFSFRGIAAGRYTVTAHQFLPQKAAMRAEESVDVGANEVKEVVLIIENQ